MKYTSIYLLFFCLFCTYFSASLHLQTFLQISANYTTQINAAASISEDLKSSDQNINQVSDIFNAFWTTLNHLVPYIRQELIDSTFEDEDQAQDTLNRINKCITSEEDNKYINQLLKELIISCLESNANQISRELMEDIMNNMIEQGKGCMTHEELDKMNEMYDLLKTVNEQARVEENVDKAPPVFLHTNSSIQEEDEDAAEEQVNKINSITALQDEVSADLKPICENAWDLKYGLEDTYETVGDIIKYIF